MLNDCTVEVRGFTKRYGSKTACDHVDFSAQCGMVTGLLGPNGSGKSTLLKAVCGVHYPSEGSVSVGPYSSLSDIRRVVGFVPETPQLDRFLTVRETLESQARLYGAKSVVDLCVTSALASVLLFPGTGFSHWFDVIGSLLVSLYMIRSGLKTIAEQKKA